MIVSKDEIAKFHDIYKKYGSLRAVGRICGRSQNTVDKYISQELQVKRQNRVTEVTNDERLMGVYVGLWMGDGTQYHDCGNYRIKICGNKDDKLLNTFIQQVILKLFGKTTRIATTKRTKSAYIKFSSKFIYEYVKYYAEWDTHKTNTVRLKGDIGDKSSEFLEGCLLGLMLSDGFLKEKLQFNVTSKRLAKDMIQTLQRFGFEPSIYVHKRAKYGWKDLHMVRLNRNESKEVVKLLDSTLEKLGYSLSFREVKYGPAEI